MVGDEVLHTLLEPKGEDCGKQESNSIQEGKYSNNLCGVEMNYEYVK